MSRYTFLAVLALFVSSTSLAASKSVVVKLPPAVGINWCGAEVDHALLAKHQALYEKNYETNSVRDALSKVGASLVLERRGVELGALVLADFGDYFQVLLKGTRSHLGDWLADADVRGGFRDKLPDPGFMSYHVPNGPAGFRRAAIKIAKSSHLRHINSRTQPKERDQKSCRKPVYVTGHSLGGAMAYLTAPMFDGLIVKYEEEAGSYEISTGGFSRVRKIVTFGAAPYSQRPASLDEYKESREKAGEFIGKIEAYYDSITVNYVNVDDFVPRAYDISTKSTNTKVGRALFRYAGDTILLDSIPSLIGAKPEPRKTKATIGPCPHDILIYLVRLSGDEVRKQVDENSFESICLLTSPFWKRNLSGE